MILKKKNLEIKTILSKGLFGNHNNDLFSNDTNVNFLFNDNNKNEDLFEKSANIDASN